MEPERILTILNEGTDKLEKIEALKELLNRYDELLDSHCKALDLMSLLGPLLADVNYKIVIYAHRCLDKILQDYPDDVKNHVHIIFPNVVERFADNKVQVRKKSMETLLLVSDIWSPKESFARIKRKYFQSKNAWFKESVLLSYIQHVEQFGPEQVLAFSEMLPHTVKMLNDSDKNVRSAAVSTMMLFYQYCGKGFIDILKDQKIRASQLKSIIKQFSKVDVIPEPIPYDNRPPSPKTPRRRQRKSRTLSGSQIVQNVVVPDQENPISPIVVTTPKQLSTEFQAIQKLLENKDDWNKRLEGLRKLSALCYGGAMKFNVFLPLVLELRDTLNVQLTDLRSAIVKDTCAVILLIVGGLKDEFLQLGLTFIHSLLKLTVATVQIIADSGNNCIRSIISNCYSVKLLSTFSSKLSQKKNHKVLRIRSSEYILLMLETYQTTDLEKYQSTFVNAMKQTMSDPIDIIRLVGRHMFWQIHRHWPQVAEQILNREFDASTQKRLLSDAGKPYMTFESASSGRSLGSPGKSSTKRSPSRPEHNFSQDAQNFEVSEPSLDLSMSKFHDISAIEEQPETFVKTKSKSLSKKRDHSTQKVTVSNHQATKKRNRSRPSSASSIQKSSPTKSKSRPASTSYKRKSVNQPESTKIRIILQSHKSSDWAERVSVFRKLEDVRVHPERQNEYRMCLNKILKVIYEKLSDTHYKVVLAAMEVLTKIIPQYHQEFHLSLEKILPKIFLKLTDPKEMVRNVSGTVLEVIGTNYTGDTLYPILLKVCDNSNFKIRLGCLEYMYHILPQSTLYLSHGSHMKQCMLKLSSIATQKLAGSTSKSCRAASISLLLLLYKMSATIFLEQFLQIPMGQQYELQKILIDKIPHFEEELHEMQTGDVSSIGVQREELYPTATNSQRIRLKDSATSKNQQNRGKNALMHRSDQNNISQIQEEHSNHDSPSSEYYYESEDLQPDFFPESNQPVSSKRLSDDQRNLSNTKEHISHQGIISNELLSMTSKLNQASGPSDRLETLYQIRKLAHIKDEEAWLTYFAKVLFIVLDVLHDEIPEIREASLNLMTDLLEHQTPYFEDFFEISLKRILEKLDDDDPTVAKATDKCVDMMIAKIDPLKILKLLTKIILKEKDVVETKNSCKLLGGITMLAKLVFHMDEDDLLKHVPTVLPGLFQAFKHPDLRYRKVVVYCLVDMYIVLGDRFRPFLARLNRSELKLVTIYMQKSQRGNSNADVDL